MRMWSANICSSKVILYRKVIVCTSGVCESEPRSDIAPLDFRRDHQHKLVKVTGIGTTAGSRTRRCICNKHDSVLLPSGVAPVSLRQENVVWAMIFWVNSDELWEHERQMAFAMKCCKERGIIWKCKSNETWPQSLLIFEHANRYFIFLSFLHASLFEFPVGSERESVFEDR
jgi:hypothetical protein